MIDLPLLPPQIMSATPAPLSLSFLQFDTTVACSEALLEGILCQIPQCPFLAAAEGRGGDADCEPSKGVSVKLAYVWCSNCSVYSELFS